ncbi:heat shock 70 kDa protein II [Asbolus verrucosus]|uniref:Heat shock 70 kDa protein II n=1 Tax=Asbolus verrucosus TaxID=1661398 RepID=A0A482VSY1_ASBVE|nr:heat shock 70 kDa protein II [Asbolus verrucosus]
MDSELIVGIDLGTTNSCIAVKRNGRIDVIPNSEGKRTTLSFVYYGENNILVGKTAKHEAASKPANGIYEIKRLIGCLHDDPDIESEKHCLTYNFIRGTNGEVKIELDNNGEKSYKLPEEVCARILHKLKVDAEDYLGQTITKAVVTVPAYFNNNQRAATRDAAKMAGFEVLKLINEPSAAALAYINENKSVKERTILIYDLGGGTFDVSVVRAHSRNIRVLSVDGDTHLGGQDFLNRLVDYVVGKIEGKCKIQIRRNKRYMRHIINMCEKTKKILATAPRTVIVPEFATEAKLEITRAQFEEINDDLFKETIRIVDSCIKNVRLNKNQIDEVLLVGGSSRIPKIETLLKQYFDNKNIQRNINADEAIAIGAAIEADYLLNLPQGLHGRNSILIDVLPLSIGTVIDEETIFFNFARNTPLPAESKHVYTIKKGKYGSNKGCILSIYEGGHLDCNKNVLLGAHEIKWINSTAAKRDIEIIMQINTYGIIWITAKGDTIKTFSIALNKGRLDDEEIWKLSQEIQNTIEGVSTPIVTGFSKPTEPDLGQYPFHASLMQLMEDKKTYHSFCGGSLIHPKWVLTAAHCIQLDENSARLRPSEAYVALGSIYRSAQTAQILRVERLSIHPTYLSTGGRNDVGLVKLKRSAQLGRNVNLIRLHVNNKESLLNETAYLTGFGIINDLYETPKRLRKAVLHISNYDKCFSDEQFKSVEICAASRIAEGKACKGDSGGPLFITRRNRNIQIGVTSHLALLPFCRVAFNNSVYTRVSAYINWISKVTGINFTRYNQN